MKPWHLSLALLPALLLPACDDGASGDDEGANNVDCGTVTVPKFAEMTAWAKCTTCHSSTLTAMDRKAAPPGIDFDTYASAKANAQTAMDEVEEGAMPLAGYPELTADEKSQIINWASCDTPN